VNPFGFAEDSWLRRVGCGSALARTGLEEARVLAGPAPMLPFDRIERLRLQWREGLRRHIAGRLQHSSGHFMISLLLGDRSGLEQVRLEGWRASGLAHLLALSGMHVSLMAVLMAQALSLLRFPPWMRDTVLVLFLPLYVWVCGWPASVVRAALMALLMLVARRLERPQHLFAVLVLGAEIQVLLQPGQLLDVGFQLSYLAVAALALCPAWLPAVEKAGHWLKRGLAILWGTLLTSLAITVFTAGITFGVFGRLPIGGMLLNLVAIPVCDGLLAAGLFHCVVRLPGDPIPALCEAAIVLLDLFAGWGSDARTHILWQPGPGWSLWLCAVPFLLVHPRAWARRTFGMLMVVCLAAGVLLVEHRQGLLDDQGLELLALDVEQGDATLIRAPGGERVLVDTGLKDMHRDMGRRLLPVLRKLAPEGLDWLVLTHPDTDHIGGAVSILRGLPVRAVLTNGQWTDNPLCDSLRIVLDSLGLSPRRARPGMELARDPRWRLQVLGPPRAGGLPAGNESSVVLRVVGGGCRVILTGDAGHPAEHWLLDWGEVLESEVLKLGHHGSKHSTSQEWLKAVSPQLALVSCGRGNRYGHPTPLVMERVRQSGAEVRRSDHHRAVWLRCAGGVVEELDWEGRPPGPLYTSVKQREEQ
jgi:competence protein ComEC